MKHLRSTPFHSKAFTLLEMMVVLLIIALILGTVAFMVQGIQDPWGHKLVYRNPGKHNAGGYDVLSLGADGLENTEDDIGNW